jgi:hypothetical protein
MGKSLVPRKSRIIKTSEIRLHFGRKGSGKSYLGKRIVEKRSGLVAIWDPRSEWAGPQAHDPPQCEGVVLVRSLRAFLRVQATRRHTIGRVLVFQCSPREFPTWCQWVLRRGTMLAVVDELHLLAGPHESTAKIGPFLELVRVSRHAQVDLLGIAQRPKSVHGDVRAQADRVIAFQCAEPSDLGYFSDVGGKEWAAGLATLKPRQYREHCS